MSNFNYTSLTSGVPVNYIYDDLDPPLFDLLANGGLEAFFDATSAMKEFSSLNSILPDDQMVGGKLWVELNKCRDLPDGDLRKEWARKTLVSLVDAYNGLVKVNTKASMGGYIPEPSIRHDIPELFVVDSIKVATKVMKELLAVLNFTTSGKLSLIDIGGGNGNILGFFKRVGDFRFEDYVNIDRNVNNKTDRFDYVVREYKDHIGNMILQPVDFNDYVGDCIHEYPDALYFSINSSYHLMPHVLEELFKLRFSGIAMCSDLLFSGSNMVQVAGITLELVELQGCPSTLRGAVSTYNIGSELPKFSEDYRNPYPARFLQPPIQFEVANHPFLNSYIVFGDCLSRGVCLDMSSSNGVDMDLVPIDGTFKFRRPKMYKLQYEDFYWFDKIGYFLSQKIDGITGFLHQFNGSWILTLRDGTSRLPLTADRLAVNFGNGDRAIVVEVLLLKTGKYCLFFIDYVPFKYDKKLPLGYWKERFVPWNTKLALARLHQRCLFFKEYYWIPPGCIREVVFHNNIPSDGLVFQCPFGSYSCFWKQYDTCDAMVRLEKDKCFTLDKAANSYTVLDPYALWVQDGIYELVYDEMAGKFVIMVYRMDKFEAGELIFNPFSDFFEWENDNLLVGKVRVGMVCIDLKSFLQRYGDTVKELNSKLVTLQLTPSQIFALCVLVYGDVVGFGRVGSNPRCFLGQDMVKAIHHHTHYSPAKVWNAFFSHGLVDCSPFKPIVEMVDKYVRSVICFTDKFYQQLLN